jgi:small subunit ribosomal protein S14
MAKKSMIERDKRRGILIAKYAEKRATLKEEFRQAETLDEKLAIHQQIHVGTGLSIALNQVVARAT